MDERIYIAISIKHSRSIHDLWFWARRTKEGENRSFSGYSNFYNKDGSQCELYSLKDFQEHYGNGCIKCDEPVLMCSNLLRKYKELDTVLVAEEDYKNWLK